MINKKIEYFFSVVETGSFSGAAKKHFLSQPAISQQILLLEKEIGLTLFDRSGYRPILTKAGQYFYDECQKLTLEYQHIILKAHRIQSDVFPCLQIGITGPMEEKFLPVIVKIFRKAYPNIDIKIKKTTFSSGITLIKNGTLDAAFGITNDFMKNDSISFVTLLKHQVYIICSREHRWANKLTIEGKELVNEPIISLSPFIGDHFYDDFMKSFELDGVKPDIIKQVDSLEELFFAVRLNEGIALTSKEVVPDTNDLCVLDIINTHHHANFCIGFDEKHMSLYLKDFIHMIKVYFQKDYKNNL